MIIKNNEHRFHFNFTGQFIFKKHKTARSIMQIDTTLISKKVFFARLSRMLAKGYQNQYYNVKYMLSKTGQLFRDKKSLNIYLR